jgi:integrase
LRSRTFGRFAYLTGWRKGEIISLKWTDVDRDAGAIRLRPEAAKSGRGRTVMLEGDLAELIDRRWQARLFEKDGNVRDGALVFHRDGELVEDFRRAWATACRDPRQAVPRPASHRCPEQGSRVKSGP